LTTNPASASTPEPDRPGAGRPMPAVTLLATSRADDAGYRALNDVAQLTAALGADYRVVGGQMTALLVTAFAATLAPRRATADADLGTEHHVIADPRLILKLQHLGYQDRPASNTFIRKLGDDMEASIDILGPSGTTRLESGVGGDITYDAIPGLQLALAREPVVVNVRAILTDGSELNMSLRLPDPLSALVLKSFAWESRYEPKDALDIWRLLEVCLVAGVAPKDFGFGSKKDAAGILRRGFGRPSGFGVKDMAPQAINRVTAIVARVIGIDNTQE
jgi:hypothetical protein